VLKLFLDRALTFGNKKKRKFSVME
jgi:hypothetical protein